VGVDGNGRRLRRNEKPGTPFWMSKRECDVAAERCDIYRVRRVFHFRNEVKMFDNCAAARGAAPIDDYIHGDT
jgi:hypothetical protein